MQHDSETKQPSLLGLDQKRSVWQKLGTTFIFLLMGILMLLPTMILSDEGRFRLGRWLRVFCLTVVETIWVFIALGFVFNWWHPRWLRTAYGWYERKMYRLYWGLGIGFLVGLVVLAVALVIESLQSGRW
jgi:hypothetical protein